MNKTDNDRLREARKEIMDLKDELDLYREREHDEDSYNGGCILGCISGILFLFILCFIVGICSYIPVSWGEGLMVTGACGTGLMIIFWFAGWADTQ
jgi:hypothetical protein